jgi:peptidoglycan/LPS O-acetylase OafA/YrhL
LAWLPNRFDRRIGRIDIVDAMRGVAILVLVAYHFLFRWAPPRAAEDFLKLDGAYPGASFGWAGVELFFVVSGLMVCIAISRAPDASDFLIKRIAKIYPSFAVVSVIVFGALSLYDPLSLNVGLREFWLNFLILPQNFGIEPVDGIYWVVGVEIKYFLWVAVCFVAFKQKFWMGLAAVGAVGSMAMGASTPLGFKLFIAPYMPCFLIGVSIWLGAVERRLDDFILMLAFSLVLYLLQASQLTQEIGSVWVPHAFILGCSALFGFVLWLVPGTPLPPLSWLGRISLPLFLVHQKLGVTLIHAWKSMGASDLVAVGATVILMLGLAWLIFTWVEIYAQRAILGLYRKLRYGS